MNRQCNASLDRNKCSKLDVKEPPKRQTTRAVPPHSLHNQRCSPFVGRLLLGLSNEVDEVDEVGVGVTLPTLLGDAAIDWRGNRVAAVLGSLLLAALLVPPDAAPTPESRLAGRKGTAP